MPLACHHPPSTASLTRQFWGPPQITANNYEVLTDVRTLLASSHEAQVQFVAAGGATVLCQLLHHDSAMIQKKALKALLLVAKVSPCSHIVLALHFVSTAFPRQSRKPSVILEVGRHETIEYRWLQFSSPSAFATERLSPFFVVPS
jgi:hypothetical protein